MYIYKKHRLKCALVRHSICPFSKLNSEPQWIVRCVPYGFYQRRGEEQSIFFVSFISCPISIKTLNAQRIYAKARGRTKDNWNMFSIYSFWKASARNIYSKRNFLGFKLHTDIQKSWFDYCKYFYVNNYCCFSYMYCICCVYELIDL